MRFAYYPGCSLLSSAKEYDMSLRAVFAKLGIELVEIEDWNCCGAVHVGVSNPEAALMLPARNLALAEAQGFTEIVTPCSLCYRNLRKTNEAVAASKAMRQKINAGLGDHLKIEGNLSVLHPLYALVTQYGLDKIKAQVTHPLKGLKVASYYGCLMTRPKGEFDSTERPTGLDQLMAVLGAEVVDYPMKAKCCGGALALSHSQVTARLTGNVLVSARDAGADVVTLGCPMCHMALDAYQSKAEQALGQSLNLPVLFFTQVMGLALGIERQKLGLQRHLVSPEPQLLRLGL